MSTNILDASSDTVDNRYISLTVVRKGRAVIEDLADFVGWARNDKGLSLRDVENNSGGMISKGYVGQIENRDVLGDAVTPQKLQALALGLKRPIEEIIAVVFRLKFLGELNVEELSLLRYFRSIPLERKTDALGYLEMLFNLYGIEGEEKPKADKSGPKPGAVYDAVAGVPKAVRGGRKKGSSKKKSGKSG